MIKEELLIQNKRVDLYQDGKINRTLTLNSLGNITAKQSSYSQTIKLPRTANNILIFEGLGIAGNTSELAYNKLRCDYLYNSIPIFLNGYAIITSVTSETYNITIYNGIIELGEAIKDKKLSELNLSGLTHSISVDNYQNIINTENSNIQYSVIVDNVERPDEGYVPFGNETSTYNLSETFPFVKTEYIFKEIIEQAGFEIEGDLFNDSMLYDNFKTEYVTLSEGYVLGTPQQNIITEISNIQSSYLNVDEGVASVNMEFLEPFERTDDITHFNSPTSTTNVTIDSNSFTTNFDGVLRLEILPNYNISNGEYVWLQLYQNGVLINGGAYFQNNTNNGVLQYNEFYTNDGDVYTWKVKSKSKQGFTFGFNPDFGQWLDFSFNFNYTIKLNESESVIVSGDTMILGEDKQLDFVKDVVNRYGLLLYKNETTNVITTKNIDNLLKDKANAIDYSLKLDGIKSEEFTNGYAQENHFKFKYSENPNTEIDTSGFYDDSFILDNKLATTEKTVFTSIFEVFNENPFTTSYFNNYYQSNLYLKHSLLRVDEETINYEPVENKLKLVRLFKSEEPVDYKINFNGLTPVPINDYFIYPTLPKPYSEVFNEYYSKFIELLDKYKTVKVDFNFNGGDIRNFDFYKLIYLKQTGRYYYANKLKYNVASPTVEAELVEIPF